MIGACRYELAPAFNVLPSGQGLGYQQMRVGSDMADSTVANALSEAAQFGLTPMQARDAVQGVQQPGAVSRPLKSRCWRFQPMADKGAAATLASRT